MLLTQGSTTRGTALESVTLLREPFRLTSSSPLTPGERTRIILFAYNLSGADIASLTVDAEDELRRRYDFKVEYVGPLPGAELVGVSQVVVKLNDSLGEVGDVLVQLTYKGLRSNRVRVGIGFIGGGLPDDVSRLAGRVTTAGGAPLNGAMVTLSGATNATTFSDINGDYAFTNLVQNNTYTVRVARQNYSFSPPSQTLNSLVGNPSANFTGTLLNYTVSGKITFGSDPLPGTPVNLSGSQSATTTTDANGNYSFTVPAEGNYTITPSPQFFSFNTSSVVIFNLSGNHVFNFSVLARTLYSISGHIYKNGTTTPLGGATVVLGGTQNVTTNTDSAGYYIFYGVTAGGSYTVTPLKTNYSFSPVRQSYPNLNNNQTQDFNSTLIGANFTISGQILDGETPLPGVTMTLSGSKSETTTTDPNGNYSFTVSAEGDYTVIPTHPSYMFTPPGSSVLNLSSNQKINFKTSNLFSVLEFNGSPQTVDYGEFFHLKPGQTQLGKFFWEFWAMPGDNAYSRYMLSDGYGGAHALLFGFTGGPGDGRYSLSGNVWNGATGVQFGSDDGPAPNEWGHYAVGWDGLNIITYFNGVPVGLTPFKGPRMPAGDGNGGGRLFIGGSDHSNFMGRIAQVRGFEGINPRDLAPGSTFAPSTLFGLTSELYGPRASFLTSFLRPAQVVPDLAGGLAGVLRGTGNSAPVNSPTYPLPQYVTDLNAPNTSTTTAPVAPAVKVDTPLLPPDRALIFDSFSRKNSTYAFDGRGGLGSTESGSAGPKQWKEALAPGGDVASGSFGILNGRVVPLSTFTLSTMAWVETGSTTGNLQIGVSRNPRFWNTGLDTGICFRVVDTLNFFFAYTSDVGGTGLDTSPTRRLTVGYYQNGVRHFLLFNELLPADWSKRLIVVTRNTGQITVYVNEETIVYQTTNPLMANATGAGIFNYGYALGLMNRWDEFLVRETP